MNVLRNQCSTKEKAPRPRGIALILCLVVLALLSVLSVAMLGFSRQQSQRAISQDWNSVARANARLALNLAIAQLQEAMGPDQRVSATAGIFDTNPDTLPIEGVTNPSHVGVWRTTVPSANNLGDPIISRVNDGYLVDRRNPQGAGTYNHKNDVLAWLVSSPRDVAFDPRTAVLDGSNSIVLDTYYENSAATPKEVRAPKVGLISPSGQEIGGYAYHVTDLGAAAPISQFNPRAAINPSDSNPTDGGLANLFSGKKRPYGQLQEMAAPLNEVAADAFVSNLSNKGKLISLNTTGITPSTLTVNAPAKQLIERYPLDFTVSNAALFTDTLNGGLRVDLSQYLNNQGNIGTAELEVSPGLRLNDYSPLIEHPRMRQFSPKLGAFRDYVQLGTYVGNDRLAAPRVPLRGGGILGAYADPIRAVRQGLHPIISEYSLYYACAPDQAESTGLSLQFYPRVTLWNPYNVAIDTSRYVLQIHQRSAIYFDLRNIVNNTTSFYGYYHWLSYFGSDPNINDGARTRGTSLIFNLAPVRIEPGQALVFIPQQGVGVRLQNRDQNIHQNILVPFGNPQASNRGLFYTGLGSLNNSAVKYNPAIHGNQYALQRSDTVGSELGGHAILRYNSSNAASFSYGDLITNQSTDNARFPIIHVFEALSRSSVDDYYRRFSNAGGSGGLDFRILASNNPNAQTGLPHNRLKYGARLKAWNEFASNRATHNTAMWNYPIFEASNLKSPHFRRFPWDNPIASTTKNSDARMELAAFGPITTDEFDQPGYESTFMAPSSGAGGILETSPFLGSQSYAGTLRFPVFDVPSANTPFLSFAQFRSAALTHEFSAPSFIVGESLATVTAPRNQTAYTVSDYVNQWWNGLLQSNVTNQNRAAWWQVEYSPDRNYSAFDYRYETNYALWDRYFLSTIPRYSDLNNYVSSAQTLPNHRIEVSPSASTEVVTESNVAKRLTLNSHHSVNSTSFYAWKTLLSMNLGVPINGRTTSANAVPFPGTSNPNGNGKNGGNFNTPNLWEGYRQLTEAEIDRLTTQLIAEVKRRAPFISISDFVNRRLYDGPSLNSSPQTQSATDRLSYAGPLEVAIQQANINTTDIQINGASSYENSYNPAPSLVTANMPRHPYAGAPVHLSQGKVLQTIGSALTARSDTFKIRAYGEAKDNSGRVLATAHCEAIVQRTINFVDGANLPETPNANLNSMNLRFGRKFVVQSFRWMGREELDAVS